MSQFGIEKFTTRSREAIEAAQLSATKAGNTATEPVHLLVALLDQSDGTTRSLVAKAGVDPDQLQARAQQVEATLPRATGATVQQPGRLRGAHPGARGCPRPRVLDEGRLRRHRAPPDRARRHPEPGAEGAARRRAHRGGAARGSDGGPRQPPGDQPGGRVDVRRPREVLRRPDRVGAGRSPRPRHRARRRDPAGHPGAEPADQEQPGADRRARRRQDRRRRGAGPARGRR